MARVYNKYKKDLRFGRGEHIATLMQYSEKEFVLVDVYNDYVYKTKKGAEKWLFDHGYELVSESYI